MSGTLSKKKWCCRHQDPPTLVNEVIWMMAFILFFVLLTDPDIGSFGKV